MTNINEMKDWGLSFQNEKSAKIFHKLIMSRRSDFDFEDGDLLGKRDNIWSDDNAESQQFPAGKRYSNYTLNMIILH